MSKILNLSVNTLLFGDVNLNDTSSPQTVIIENQGTEVIFITDVTFPTHFKGYFNSVGLPYVSSQSDIKLGRSFDEGIEYFKASDGSLTIDYTETGISMGFGTINNTLDVDIHSYLIDHDGFFILDHDDGRIET